MRPFSIETHAVTNAQFKAFTRATKYKTEAEEYQWSFVLDPLASDEVRAAADGPEGLGRVQVRSQPATSYFDDRQTPKA